MESIPGFSALQPLMTAGCESLYGAIRSRGGKPEPVLLRFYRDSGPVADEFDLTQRLNLQGILKPIEIAGHADRPFLVLEHFEGSILKSGCPDRLPTVAAVLAVSRMLLETLGCLHTEGILHLAVNPYNVLVAVDGEQGVPAALALTGLGHSVKYGGTGGRPDFGGFPAEFLPYIAPELTGRIDAEPDFRSDYYSLGATIYDLAAGLSPFADSTPDRTIYAHLARTPPPLHEIRGGIPPALSALVARLLAKDPADRYSSAHEALCDLRGCGGKLPGPVTRRRFAAHGAPFPAPAAARLLRGRAREQTRIRGMLERVAAGGHALLTVSGHPGIGKTALVRGTILHDFPKGGRLLSGKFEQNSSTPYDAFVQAIQSNIRGMLSRAEAEVGPWKERTERAIAGAVGPLTVLFPAIALIAGTQPEAGRENGGSAASRRHYLHRAVERLLRSWTEEVPATVLFLDDLQWADPSSLDLCIHLADAAIPRLLLAVAYRGNEIPPEHPHFPHIRRLEESSGVEGRMPLGPVEKKDIGSIVGDLFPGLSRGQAASLRRLTEARTGGNPFFIVALAGDLLEERSLRFDFLSGRWIYRPSDGGGREESGDVTAFLSARMRELPAGQRGTLRMAACFSRGVPVRTLAALCGDTPERMAAVLKNLCRRGYLSDADPDGGTAGGFLRFPHDSLRQAAYCLNPADGRPLLHLRIGKLLAESRNGMGDDTLLYDTVEHLELAQPCIADPEERYHASALTMEAGIKAKRAGAFPTAFRYLSFAIRLLPSDCWRQRYGLSLSLHREAAEAAYLVNRADLMNEWIDAAIGNCRTYLDSVRSLEVRMQHHMASFRLPEAVRLCQEVLIRLGFARAVSGNRLLDAWNRFVTRLLFQRLDFEAPVCKPMRDPAAMAALRVMIRGYTPIYIAETRSTPVLVTEMARVSLRHGFSFCTPFAFGAYAMGLALRRRIGRAIRVGELSLRLMREPGYDAMKAGILPLFHFFVKHWCAHFRESIDPLLEALRTGMETGDYENAGLAGTFSCLFLAFSGMDLTAMEREVARIGAVVDGLHQERSAMAIARVHQFLLNLIGAPDREPNAHFSGPRFDEDAMLPRLKAAHDGTAIGSLHMYKAVLAYLSGNIGEALGFAQIASEKYHSLIAQPVEHLLVFYHSLILLAACRESPPERRRAFLRKARAYRLLLKRWSVHGPMNFRHRYDLVCAEALSVLGRPGAEKKYLDAIQGASASRYVQDEAVAQERLAVHSAARGRPEAHRIHLAEAYGLYKAWGAFAKVRRLERENPWLQEGQDDGDTAPSAESVAPGLPMSAEMDLRSLMSAGWIISGEIEIDSLVRQILRIVIRSAGADRGILLVGPIDAPALLAEGYWRDDEIEISLRTPGPEESAGGPYFRNIAGYVRRTLEPIVINDPASDPVFGSIKDAGNKAPRCLLCAPLMHRGSCRGLVYMENSLAPGVFSAERLRVVEILAAQAAVSLENAELYRLRDALSEQREQLLQAGKLASLGILTAGVAHEVSNPCHAIRLNAETLAHAIDRIGGPDAQSPDTESTEQRRKAADAVREIRESCGRIEAVVRDLRGFVRSESAAPRVPVDLSELVEKTLRLSGSHLRHASCRVDVRLVRGLPAVQGDPHKLQQVILNLLENACKALTDRVQGMSVSTRFDRRRRSVVFEVKDQGRGMPPKMLKRVMDPLFGTRLESGGIGLGLSIAQTIVREHGGSMRFRSAMGKGTTVTVRLPVK